MLIAGRNALTEANPRAHLARTFRGCTPTLVQAKADSSPTEVRREAQLSPCTEPQSVSHPSPTGSFLRANPFPEVTDLACRLPLPTFIYRQEAVHLGDQMRIWVRTGMRVFHLTPGFSSSRPEQLDSARTAALFGEKTLSLIDPVHKALFPLSRKDNSSQLSGWILQDGKRPAAR